jgi:hypothetical protein
VTDFLEEWVHVFSGDRPATSGRTAW